MKCAYSLVFNYLCFMPLPKQHSSVGSSAYDLLPLEDIICAAFVHESSSPRYLSAPYPTDPTRAE
jgi:hypothetical protein